MYKNTFYINKYINTFSLNSKSVSTCEILLRISQSLRCVQLTTGVDYANVW